MCWRFVGHLVTCCWSLVVVGDARLSWAGALRWHDPRCCVRVRVVVVSWSLVVLWCLVVVAKNDRTKFAPVWGVDLGPRALIY
jgi:hypothetical protein